mmetsp:Transcript_66720/g.192754  ORF Transcript_66720/g.192754 Transcript_66720/m.192754 type:complete len:413 (-) Transcript_66720:311-1549(-)
MTSGSNFVVVVLPTTRAAGVVKLLMACVHCSLHSGTMLVLPATSCVCTCTVLQPSMLKPMFVRLPTRVGPRQQVPCRSLSASCGSISHQNKSHPVGRFPFAAAIGALHALMFRSGGDSRDKSARLRNLPSKALPRIWLCPGWKMSGIPASMVIPFTMPKKNKPTQMMLTRMIKHGQVEMQSTNLYKMTFVHVAVDFSTRDRLSRSCNFCPCTSTPSVWTPSTPSMGAPSMEYFKGSNALSSSAFPDKAGVTSWPPAGNAFGVVSGVLALAASLLLDSLRSRSTISGGNNMRASTNTFVTHSPMNNPNSRSGCRALKRFAKKLTDVVRDVARQLLPARTIVQAKRISTSSQRALCFQKSLKTKMMSMSMTVIKNNDIKDANVVFAMGTRTNATGTEAKIVKKAPAVKGTLRMW